MAKAWRQTVSDPVVVLTLPYFLLVIQDATEGIHDNGSEVGERVGGTVIVVLKRSIHKLEDRVRFHLVQVGVAGKFALAPDALRHAPALLGELVRHAALREGEVTIIEAACPMRAANLLAVLVDDEGWEVHLDMVGVIAGAALSAALNLRRCGRDMIVGEAPC